MITRALRKPFLIKISYLRKIRSSTRRKKGEIKGFIYSSNTVTGAVYSFKIGATGSKGQVVYTDTVTKMVV